MSLDIKICGLKTSEAVDRVLARGATHIGFIFFEKSPRHIEIDLAAELAERARERAKIVAVTVDADDEALDDIVTGLQPDILQLHGEETPDRVLFLKALYGIPVMKAFSIRETDDLRRIDAYIGIADRFLFDAKPPASSELPGGNGVAFDWSILDELDGSVDYMLSGGLNKENVAEAMARTKASGIDVSSGVETAPGVKNVMMIDDFFDAVAASMSKTADKGE